MVHSSDTLNRSIECERVHTRDLYKSAIIAGRACLKARLDDETFSRGLLLASPVLWDSAFKYQQTEDLEIRSRDQQIEQSLLRYLTRASMKATPFGRFCTIAQIGFVPPAKRLSGTVFFDRDPSITRGYVRLNKAIYGGYWRLLRADPETSMHIPIRLNDTFSTDGALVTFLTTDGNRETFQRLQMSAALQVVLNEILKHGQTSILRLSEKLAANPQLDATAEEAQEYARTLVKHGLMHFVEPVPSQSADWVTPFVASLGHLRSALAMEIAEKSRELQNVADGYTLAPARERRLAHSRFDLLLTAQDKRSSQGTLVAVRNPVFEDCSTPAHLMVALTPGIQQALAAFARWCALVSPLRANRSEQATMRHFFETEYQKADESGVPLLDFYERFYRLHVKPNERQSHDQPSENPYSLPIIQARRNARLALISLVKDKIKQDPTAEVIDLSDEEVVRAMEAIKSNQTSSSFSSVAGFCQLVAGDAEEDGYIVCRNGAHSTGFGKFLSRFLHTLPKDFVESIVAGNSAHEYDAILAEICNDGNFNANLHPDLLGLGILYPMSEAQSELSLIPVKELTVKRSSDDPHSLILFHGASGRRIVPIDLGILAPAGRPALYQLLSKFSPDGTGIAMPSGIRLAQSVVSNEGHTSDGATYRPRIVFANRLVLSRRRWSILATSVPAPESGEEGGDYLLRLNLWRVANRIPAQVFVSVSTEEHTSARTIVADTSADHTQKAPKASRRHSARQGQDDASKPQYVDFESPLLIRMLNRVCTSHPTNVLHLEECLPSRDALPSYMGSRYSFEMILEFSQSSINAAQSSSHVVSAL